MAAGPANCTYDSDPAVDLYTIDLRVEGPDPTAVEPMEDGLFLVRINYPDGQDTTVGDLPAWESEQGLWVDTGDDVFVVQPILFFATDPASRAVVPDPGRRAGALAPRARPMTRIRLNVPSLARTGGARPRGSWSPTTSLPLTAVVP